MAEFSGRLLSTEEDHRIVEELIVDYACKNYMDDVVAAFAAKRGCTCFNDIKVPHLRVAMFTVHSIIQQEDVANFENPLQLLGKVHSIAPDLLPIKKYIQLITGLKAKILLNKMSQKSFDYADVCAHLNKFFPKSELKTNGVSEVESEINSYQLQFRRRLTRLMLSPSGREVYWNNDQDDNELGPALMVSIQRLLRVYVDRVNRELPEPVIEQIIAEGPQSQIAQEFQDSQSDGIDQLLFNTFKGAPSQDALLSILKTCWEAEDATTEDMDISDMEISDNARAAAESGDSSSSDIFGRPPSSAINKSTNQDPFTPRHTVDKVKKTHQDSITRENMQVTLSSAAPKSAHRARYGSTNHKVSPPQFPDTADVVEGASCFRETSGEISGVGETVADTCRHDEFSNPSGQGIKHQLTCEETQFDDQQVDRIRLGFQESEINDSKFGSIRAARESDESIVNRKRARGYTTTKKGFTATGERFTSIREGFALVGNRFTPLREAFESVGKGFKLVGKALTPAGEGFTVIQKGINLIGEGSTSITEGFRSIAEGFTLIEEGVNPINTGLTLVRNGFTSIREGFTAFRDGFTSVKEGLTSISDKFASIGEDFAPLSEAYAVIREGIVSINKEFTPISGGLAPLSHGEGFTAIEDGFTAIEDGFTAIRESQGENMVGVASSTNIPAMSKSLPVTGSVSGSRIYLSKNHHRTKPHKKGTPNNFKACLEQAQSWQVTPSGTEEMSHILKSYNRNECDAVYISPNYLTSDPSNSQVSKSSHGSSQRSASDQSNCSLSILAGLPVGRSVPVDSRSGLGGMTSLEEEMRELTSVVHNPVVPDLQVYPVIKSDDAVSLEPTPSGGSPEVVPETPLSEQADGRSAMRQVSEHDNTDNNGENIGNLASDDQGVFKMEQTGRCRTTDVHDQTMDVLDFIDAKEKHPVVMLRRLSQDSNAKKYLNCSEPCEDTGELSLGEDSSSDESESNDSFVSDSDDGTGSWSDSSSLPSIELRPDSEIPFVRRIPTLKRYLHTPPKKHVTEGLIQMRECTVRLYKMRPRDIRALTKDKKKRCKRLDFTPR